MRFFGLAAAIDAVLATGAQTVAGVKSFTSALVAAAGVQLASLWNTNGSRASDVCLKVGTSTADGSVDAAATLLAVRTGIGGAEVTYAAIGKGKVSFGQAALDAAAHFVLPNDTTPAVVTAWDSRHTVFGQAGSQGRGLGVSSTASTSVVNLIYLQPGIAWQSAKSFCLDWYLYTAGTVLGLQQSVTGLVTCNLGLMVGSATGAELTTAGAGIILKSPDGTRYKLTIANGGAVSVAAA